MMPILLSMPTVQIILLGFAITTKVKNACVAILNPSNDVVIRQIVGHVDASEYFTITRNLYSPREVDHFSRKGDIDMAVAFGEHFSDHLYTDGVGVQIIFDAIDPNMVTMQTGYATNIISMTGQEMLPPRVYTLAIVPQVKLLYNPQMKNAYDFVPGIMRLIPTVICAMMTSTSVVCGEETGTMEVSLVSLIRPLFIILAKAAPYFVLSSVNLITILLLSVYVLHIPVTGGLFRLVVVSLLLIFVSLALGLLISTVTHTQVAVTPVSGLILMIPTMLLSSMIFPIESMSVTLQGISIVIPARWYIQAVRRLMIEGMDISLVLTEVSILAVTVILLITVSLKRLRNRLEWSSFNYNNQQ